MSHSPRDFDDGVDEDKIMVTFRTAGLAFLLFQGAFGQSVKLDVDQNKSSLVVATDKGGLFRFLGHKHGIIPAEWSAVICADPKNWQASQAVISIQTASLRIDTPEALKLAGVNSKGPSENDVKKIQQQMLSPENLAAESHSEIRFEATSVQVKNPNELILNGSMRIRGITRPESIGVKVAEPAAGVFRFTGNFTVKQTDYGIRPASVAGVVDVKDSVDIRFDLWARTTTEACK